MAKFIITGPSGAGKTTVSEALLAQNLSVSKVVTHTTRAARPGEVDGVHYHFVTDVEFRELVYADALVEYAFVYGFWYGTARQEIAIIHEENRHPLLVLDIQGALWWKNKFPSDTYLIFLAPPPSSLELMRRLRIRATDSVAEINRRVSESLAETNKFLHSDMTTGYLAISRDVQTTVSGISSYIRSKSFIR